MALHSPRVHEMHYLPGQKLPGNVLRRTTAVIAAREHSNSSLGPLRARLICDTGSLLVVEITATSPAVHLGNLHVGRTNYTCAKPIGTIRENWVTTAVIRRVGHGLTVSGTEDKD
ncbi:hypothetical protein Bbelb_090730 [Branchiostoma belcheri]|nr:hypothetical protein Bbelb_090730 [Branchiostoma belcheri]